MRVPGWNRRIPLDQPSKITTRALPVFFVTRGLWLLLLEFTIVDLAWGFVPWTHSGVIWILGWSMVTMALILRLPVRWITVLGLGMIATHNLVDRINPTSFGKFYGLWILLHSPGRIRITDQFSFSVRHVLIPWVGVMAVGIAFGKLLLRPDRRKWILILGISATVLVFVLRAINLYGSGIADLPYGYHVLPADGWHSQYFCLSATAPGRFSIAIVNA